MARLQERKSEILVTAWDCEWLDIGGGGGGTFFTLKNIGGGGVAQAPPPPAPCFAVPDRTFFEWCIQWNMNFCYLQIEIAYRYLR